MPRVFCELAKGSGAYAETVLKNVPGPKNRVSGLFSIPRIEELSSCHRAGGA